MSTPSAKPDRLWAIRPGVLEITRRWGTKSAKHYVSYSATKTRIPILTFAVLGFVGAGGILKNNPLAIIGALLILALIFEIPKAFIEFYLMTKAMSKARGIRVRRFAMPPYAPNQYRLWCQARGLDPYPFTQATPPKIPLNLSNLLLNRKNAKVLRTHNIPRPDAGGPQWPLQS